MSFTRQLSRWKNSEVGTAIKRSKRMFSSQECDIRIAPATSGIARVLPIISCKMGNSPQRNQFKRRIKSIFYEEKLYALGYNWIVFAKKGAACADFTTFRSNMLNVAQQLQASSLKNSA